MKSVTTTEIVRANRGSPLRFRLQAWRQMRALAITLAIGLPALIGAFHLLDPGAPLGWIVLPVLAGGIIPVFAALPGRFEVSTRFDARLLVATLEHSLSTLGYAAAGGDASALHYRPRKRGWFSSGKDIAVTLRERNIEIVGPMATLRVLQRQIAC